MSAPIFYAFTLGLVAAINPCGFPLLPAYLTLFLGSTDLVRSRTVTALVAGGCVTLGFVVAFGGIGILVQIGALVLAPWTLWLTAIVGAVLIVVGILGLLGRAPTLRLRSPGFAPGRSVAAMTGFGLAYALSSLSCALPLFLAAVSSSFGRYGLLDGLTIFLSYALGMGVFVTGASVVTAHLGAGSLRRIRPLSRFVPVVSGILVLIVGLYLAFSSIASLVDPVSLPVVAAVEALQAAASEWLVSRALAVGCLLLAIVLAGIVLLAVSAHRSSAHSTEETHV